MNTSWERWLGWVAAACWLASWLLPVTDDYAGWTAFLAALAGRFPEEYVPQILSALTNLVFVVLFLIWMDRRITLPVIYLKVAIVCLVLDCYWLVQAWRMGETGALRVGYYAWLAAFALLVAVGILSVVSARRTSRTPTAGTPA